jgi:hypothetical protein
MCRIIPLLLIFSFYLSPVSAQNRERGIQDSRIFTGGGLGLQIGTITLIDVSPHIGYYLTERIAVGIGGTYQYYRIKTDQFEYSTDIWGARAFGRYYFLENIFGHIEYEYLNYEAALVDPYGFYSGDIKRVGVNNVLVGAGYRENIFGNSYINALLLWNLNETVYTLYSNPILRVGIDVGL